MANVLVVGGAGYVGGAVTDRLMETAHNVRVYDSLVYEDSYRKPLDFVIGDVRDQDRLGPHLRWADVVVWLAAIVGDGACALNPDLTVDLNDRAVGRLAEEFDRRIVFVSTCSVYGANDELLDERSPVNPLSIYAQTKLAAEGHLISKNAITFRLGTLFGVSDHFSRIRMDLAVNVLTAKAYVYRKISVFGGNQYRPLLHVKDVGAAIVQTLETAHTGVFNLHAVNMQIVDLADHLKAQFPDREADRGRPCGRRSRLAQLHQRLRLRRCPSLLRGQQPPRRFRPRLARPPARSQVRGGAGRLRHCRSRRDRRLGEPVEDPRGSSLC